MLGCRPYLWRPGHGGGGGAGQDRPGGQHSLQRGHRSQAAGPSGPGQLFWLWMLGSEACRGQAAQHGRQHHGSHLSPHCVCYNLCCAGCGEHLVRTFLARECGLALSTSDQPLEDLQRVMKEKFAESVFLTGVPEKLGGAICLQVWRT